MGSMFAPRQSGGTLLPSVAEQVIRQHSPNKTEPVVNRGVRVQGPAELEVERQRRIRDMSRAGQTGSILSDGGSSPIYSGTILGSR